MIAKKMTLFLFLMSFNSFADNDCPLLLDKIIAKHTESQKFALEAQKLSNSLVKKGRKVRFTGIDNKDVYNITAPFNTDFMGKRIEVIAGRVESRESEHSSVVFFTKSIENKKEIWSPLIGAPSFTLQDPFITNIDGEIIFGGVQLVEKDGKIISYFTSFYRGKTISDLQHFTDGPQGMKDIRIFKLPSNKIGVFTRPQGEIGGRGKIGYIEIDNLTQLTPEIINTAKLLENLAKQFGNEAWGGVNAAYPLSNGQIGVLGHIAYWSNEGTPIAKRHYHSATFNFNPKTQQASDMKIIGTRSLLPKGASKRKDLEDVIFSGGLQESKGKYFLYGGAGDAEAFRLPIENPFIAP